MNIVFMGTPDFAVASLDAIYHSSHHVVGVVTVPDRQTGRGLKLTCSPVKEYAIQHSLRLLQPEKLRNEEFLSELRSLHADLFVVVAFRMLPKEVWAMPHMGTFNLHASLLPQYRGAAPINWAIINGETESGVTTFLLNEHIDEGCILMQERTPITPTDNAETLHDRLSSMGSRMVVQTIDGLANRTLKGIPQKETSLLKPAPKIFKNDCAIHWELTGNEIVNFVRGLSPYPAATMQMIDDNGKIQQFKIFKANAEKTDEIHAEVPVGNLLSDEKNYIKVRCQDGFVSILELQINGKRRNSVSEFLRGYKISNWKITR